MSALRGALVLAAALAAAAPAPTRAAFDDLGSGARAPGMGNAFTALADDVHTIHYNPAGLAQLERPQLALAYSRLHMGLSDGSELGLAHAAYAHPLKRGRWGTLGGSWERFTLNDIYGEQALFVSWGKRALVLQSGSRLLAGLSAKYLRREFKQLPEAFNACDQLACNKGPDPVLTGATSKGTVDADFGLLYRFPRRLQAGLLVQHVMRPDVGFAAPDRLPMNLHFGLAYKALWMTLAGELRMDQAPGGSRDRDLILAAERVFPTLEYGQFGLRSSLGFGSRQWRQATFGLSYRINKVQLDYGFMLPIGTIKGTAGTHRMGMSFHFGAPTPEDDITQELLLQARRVREGQTPAYGYEFMDQLRPKSLSDPALAEVRGLIEAGKHRQAHTRLAEMAKDLPPEEAVVRLANRIGLVAGFFPELAAPELPWEIVLASSARNFAYGRDRAAVLQASYALSLAPENGRLESYLAKLEEGLSTKGERLPPGHPRGFIEEQLWRVEAANNRQEHAQALSLLQDILELAPGNLTALERVGTAYYLMGRYAQALQAWEQILPLEREERERESLKAFMAEARSRLGQPGAAPAPEPSPREAAEPAPAPRAAARRGDPRDVERLYQKGIEHYARGEFLQATAMFMRVLQLDPDNEQARKALERVKRKR